MKKQLNQTQLGVRTQVRGGQNMLLVGKASGDAKQVNDTMQARMCLASKGIYPVFKPCAGVECGNYKKIPALLYYDGIKQIAGLAAIKQAVDCA